MPKANETNLILRDEVADAVAKKRFHIWSVETIDEAAEILMDMPAGQPDRHGAFEPNTIYGRVALELERFDRVLRAGPAELEGF